MIAKLYDEISRSWLLYDNVHAVKQYVGRFKLDKKRKGKRPDLHVVEIPRQNPPEENWEPHHLYLHRLLLLLSDREKQDSSFKVVVLFINQSDGSEKALMFGFTSGYLLNGDGKTIERL